MNAAVKVLSFLVGFAVFVLVSNWLDQYMWLVLALIAGLCAWVIVYQILVSLLIERRL